MHSCITGVWTVGSVATVVQQKQSQPIITVKKGTYIIFRTLYHNRFYYEIQCGFSLQQGIGL
jgi:hypothetical protein